MKWFAGIVLGLATFFALLPVDIFGFSVTLGFLGFAVMVFSAWLGGNRSGLTVGFWVGVVMGVVIGALFEKFWYGVLLADVIFIGSLVLSKPVKKPEFCMPYRDC